MTGKIQVKEVGEPYSIGLGRQPQQTAIGIEHVLPTRLDEFNTGLFAAVEEALANPAIDPKYNVESVGAEARDLDDFCDTTQIKGLSAARRA